MERPHWKLLERDLLVRQDLALDTVRKTLRSLETLEAGGVDLLDPRIEQYEDFIASRKLAGARGGALTHHYKAMKRLLSWRRLKWSELESPHVEMPEIELPPDHIVLRLLNVAGDQDDVELELLQFAFRLAFFTGIRPQQEHVSLRVQDYNRTTGELWVWSDKVERGRTLQLEPWLAKLFENYIDEIRPRVDAGVSTQLLLSPDGKPWARSTYRMWMSRAGREIYPWFYPYLARHWCCTWRLVETNMDLVSTSSWMGHHKIATTMRYVHIADARLRARMLAHQVQPPPGLIVD